MPPTVDKSLADALANHQAGVDALTSIANQLAAERDANTVAIEDEATAPEAT
jgi:hypothetical protein